MKSEKIIVRISKSKICSSYFFINGDLVLATRSNCFFEFRFDTSLYVSCQNVFDNIAWNKKEVSIIVDAKWVEIIQKEADEQKKWREKVEEESRISNQCEDVGYLVGEWKRKEKRYKEWRSSYKERREHKKNRE